jgi:hypothetical protein
VRVEKSGEFKINCKIIFQQLIFFIKNWMKTMFDKTQIKYFYQGYFNHDMNSKQIIVHQLNTKQRQTSMHK